MAVKGETKLEVGVVVDGGWGWIVVVGSLMIHVIADGFSYSFGLFVPLLLEYLDVGRADVGWLGSLMIGVTWGAGPIASILTNKYGCRPITILGTLVASVGIILTICAPNIWVMYVSFGLITGFGLGLIYLPAIVIVSYYFVKRRAFAIGLAVCGSGLGTFIFAPMTQVLLDEYGWRGTLLIETGLVMNCFVCGALFRGVAKDKNESAVAPVLSGDGKETPEIPARFISPIQSGHLLQNNESTAVTALSNDSMTATKVCSSHHLPYSQTIIKLCSSRCNSQASIDPTATRCPESHEEELMNQRIECEAEETQLHLQTSSTKSSASEVTDADGKDATVFALKHPVFIMFAVSNFLTSIGYCVPYIFLPDRAMLLGVDKEKSAFLISAIGISNTIARVVFGYIADFKNVDRLLLYNTVLVLCGIVSFLSYFCTVFYSLVAYSLLFGLFMGIYTCLIPVVLVDLFGLNNLSKSFGLVLFFGGVGAVLGPPMAGWLYDLTQGYAFSFFAMGATMTLSGAMLYPIPCFRKCQEQHFQ